MNQYAVIVIGGGPAGLFCSLLLGKGGCKTLLLEKMPTCGRKLLLSGSGQCNLTHTGPISEFTSHYGDHGRFIRPALMHFSNVKLISFFQDRGVPFRDDGNGKYFPESGKARDILNVLLKEANEAGVIIHTGEPVHTISHDISGFTVTTRTDTYHSTGVVLATGGYTYPVTGSTGDGYTLAQALGHTIAEPGPALTPIHTRIFLSGTFPVYPSLRYRSLCTGRRRRFMKHEEIFLSLTRDFPGLESLICPDISGPGMSSGSHSFSIRISIPPGRA